MRSLSLLSWGLLCPAVWGIHAPSEWHSSALAPLLQKPTPFYQSLSALRDQVETMGTVTETLIPFSDSPFHTDLEEPRIVVSVSPKLFYAAIARLDGSVDFEVISWRRNRFLFGKITGFGTPEARLETTPVSDCRMCHRTEGPIFTDRPWTNVNGANSPIGTLLSFAMLTKLIDREPQRYARFSKWLRMGPRAYDATFGNLAPEPAIALGPIRHHGTPLFSLRGSFDLDANTRRGHYLLLTHQIREALPADAARRFDRELAERALMASAHPSKLELLFSWDKYLAAWLERMPALRELPAAQSPILKNYQPLFDNPKLLEEAGILPEQVDKNPVAALVKLSDFVRHERISTFLDEFKASSDQAYLDMKPNHNAGANTVLELVFGIGKEQTQWLVAQAARKPLQPLFTQPDWLGIWSATPPEELPVIPALESWFGVSAAQNKRAKPQPPHPQQTEALALPQGHACAHCHSGTQALGGAFPWDLGSVEAWKQAFSDKQTKPQAIRWAQKTKIHLEGATMPPAESDAAKTFSLEHPPWKNVISFLRTIYLND